MVTTAPDTVAVNPPVSLPLIVVALVLVAVPLGRSVTVMAGTMVTPSTLMAPSVAG